MIGDTPRDIACARADDVRVVAVATGPFAVEALADADAVVDDARALLPVLEDFATPLTTIGAAAAAPLRLGRGEQPPPRRNSIAGRGADLVARAGARTRGRSGASAPAPRARR